MKIEIKHRYTDAVLFAYDAENNTMRLTVEAAVSAKAELRGSDLSGSNLSGERPILQIGPIGSRADFLIAYLTDTGIMIRAGCWYGTRGEFAAAVVAEHDDNVHAREYRAALAMIDAHAALWTPATPAV